MGLGRVTTDSEKAERGNQKLRSSWVVFFFKETENQVISTMVI